MNASWVAIDLMEFAVRTEDAVQSPEAALEWLRSFRDTLLMEGRNAMPMPWAVELLGMADVKIAKKSIARMQGQIVKLFGKDCDVDLECSKKYGEKYEKLKKILADGDIREDSLAKPDGSAITRNETRAIDALEPSANHYGDAAAREGAEVVNSRESGDAAPTTVSRNMRRVPQNEAPAHGFSGGRTAQGTMSRSPEAAAQSGKDYDQEAKKASTNSPDASDGNAEGVTTNGSAITRNGSIAACTPLTSGQTFEDPQNQARESQPGAGEVPPENVSAKPSPALPVPSKKAHGEFGNVLLTDDEFAKLCEKCPDADALITELDQYIESQGKTKKYKSHYATLLNWSRRKAQESKPKQGYMTSDDISKKNYQESKARLEAMFAKGRKTA